MLPFALGAMDMAGKAAAAAGGGPATSGATTSFGNISGPQMGGMIGVPMTTAEKAGAALTLVVIVALLVVAYTRRRGG